MEQQEKSQKTVIIATVAFIVGFGLAWFILSNKAPVQDTADSADTAATSTEEVLVQTGNTISIKDQAEGVNVIIDSAKLESPSWIVVYENETGRILGAQFLDKGEQSSAKVELLRGTISGKAYYAMVHTDNGDRAFDPKKDQPITDTKTGFTATK